MKKTYQLSLHIFRRDLRLQDNTALIEALRSSEQVIPCFIFDPRQIEMNDYKSLHAIQFMAASLAELQEALQKKQGKLYFFYGQAEQVVANLIKKNNIQAVFINRDYTPFSKKRDEKIRSLCSKHNIAFHCFGDALLQEPEQILKPDGKPYTVFTYAYKKSIQLPVISPRNNHHENYYTRPLDNEDLSTLKKLMQKNNPNLLVKGGRREAMALLKRIPAFTKYDDERNFPALHKTTYLSAHLKFGTLSIRECYDAILRAHGMRHTLMREIYWRDFFTHIAFYFPHVFGSAFHEKYNTIRWSSNEKLFRAWREGQTGFPIVDAGMRELNTTGYMHNRVRMITASFLTKDLHIDWRWGEQYFAQQLVDYDPAVNNGNWQWAASTGCDAQPYFRIFNPWLQQKKFDPDCLYIKQWIPELAHLPIDVIHKLHTQPQNLMTNYPMPVIDHEKESRLAKSMYKILQ